MDNGGEAAVSKTRTARKHCQKHAKVVSENARQLKWVMRFVRRSVHVDDSKHSNTPERSSYMESNPNMITLMFNSHKYL